MVESHIRNDEVIRNISRRTRWGRLFIVANSYTPIIVHRREKNKRTRPVRVAICKQSVGLKKGVVISCNVSSEDTLYV